MTVIARGGADRDPDRAAEEVRDGRDPARAGVGGDGGRPIFDRTYYLREHDG